MQLAKEYFEVFCGGSIARIDDFKALYLSRNGKTETLKGGRDKGHRREVELTVEAMRHGHPAPIPFAELIEVTEATSRSRKRSGHKKRCHSLESFIARLI